MDRDGVIGGWQRANEKLKASDLALREGMFAVSISDSYYAVFLAARAALYLHDVGVAAKTHSGTHQMFHEHLVKSGEIESEWSAYLSRQFESRLGADYDIKRHFTLNEAEDDNAAAHRFCSRIRAYLLANGFTEQELDDNA